MRIPKAPLRTLALAALVASSLAGCVLPNPISALDGDYYHVSAGTQLYVTIKRNATQELFYAQWVCLLQGKSSHDCAKNLLAVAAVVIEGNMDASGPVKWFWDHKIKRAFAADEADDFADALAELQPRGNECLRISIRSGENWTSVGDELAECSWGKDPFPGNGI